MSSRGRLIALAASALALVALAVFGYSRARDAVTTELETARPGVLTVAATLPSPGFWNDSVPADVEGGFEWAVASALADRFDLDLEVVDVPFADIVAGEFGGADLALAQIVPTTERRQVVTFGVPYLDSNFGVLVPDGESVRDLATARELSWATVDGSQQEAALLDLVRPEGEVIAVADEAEAAALVIAGEVDAALIDLTSALVIAGTDEALTVTSQVATDGRYAPAFPKGSPNVEVVDAAIRALERDGTLARLEQTWLEAVYERPVREVPVIVTRETGDG